MRIMDNEISPVAAPRFRARLRQLRIFQMGAAGADAERLAAEVAEIEDQLAAIDVLIDAGPMLPPVGGDGS
jgi:hypothetical protein